MQCNQRFFGQALYEKGTPEREFCTSLAVLKPAMAQFGYAMRDCLPQLPSAEAGLVQVKYNGMLTVVVWDAHRNGFVAWSTRGRCYYSLDNVRKHPVTEYFNRWLSSFRDLAFVGETYVVREIGDKSYMTEFNKSMSIIKNPQSAPDVNRIRLAVFDHAHRQSEGGFKAAVGTYADRFDRLQQRFGLPVGCDSGVVHLPDYLRTEGSFSDAQAQIQAFWNNFVGERGFEGVVLHTTGGKIYKIKFRDTLDGAIIAFRKGGRRRPMCEQCGARFDIFWLRKLARDGVVERDRWFDQDGRLRNGANDVWHSPLESCPLCGGSVVNSPGPILGAKIALMTPEGDFLDIADGVQFSPLSPVLDMVEPLYEDDGYLWVVPEIVVEVSYQDLYLERPRPVYRYDEGRYVRVDTRQAVSLRPYRPRLREDKTVTPQDLRLEQLSYFVDKMSRIEKMWQKTEQQKELSRFLQ